MTNATQQLPPELIPGNMGEIQERSRERQEQWAKKLDELHSLRTPPTPPAFPTWAAFGLGMSLSAAVMAISWMLF